MLKSDSCGLICAFGVYLALGYANFVVIVHITTVCFSVPAAISLCLIFAVLSAGLLASHIQCMVSDPGYVPVPDVKIDFSDTVSRKSRDDDWTVCHRCEMWRPTRAYHCKVCKRCVRKMDHHCPWVNNCVGEKNQRFFVLFLFYTLLLCLLTYVIIAVSWNQIWEVEMMHHATHAMGLLIEASMMGIFAVLILVDQLSAIISDETAIELLKRTKGKLPPKNKSQSPTPIALLRGVLGPGSYWTWLIPIGKRSTSYVYHLV